MKLLDLQERKPGAQDDESSESSEESEEEFMSDAEYKALVGKLVDIR